MHRAFGLSPNLDVNLKRLINQKINQSRYEKTINNRINVALVSEYSGTRS